MSEGASVGRHSASLLPPADAGFSSQLVSLWTGRQTRAWHYKHLTSVCAWEQLAPQSFRVSPLSDRQFTHAVVCVLLLRVQTRANNTEANY